MLGTKAILVPSDFHCMEKKKKNTRHIFRDSQKKKVIGSEQHESEEMIARLLILGELPVLI